VGDCRLAPPLDAFDQMEQREQLDAEPMSRTARMRNWLDFQTEEFTAAFMATELAEPMESITPLLAKEKNNGYLTRTQVLNATGKKGAPAFVYMRTEKPRVKRVYGD
jgi:hypothetical protein